MSRSLGSALMKLVVRARAARGRRANAKKGMGEKMTRNTAIGASMFAAIAFALGGCGGGSGAAIGGSISGLNANTSVILQDDGSDSLTVASNGSFEFTTSLAAGSSYNVTVQSEPTAEVCLVQRGSGVVDANADAVGTVSVICATTVSLAGTISGLASGMSVLLSDGQVFLPASNGAFSFPGTLPIGTSYSVTVATQPPGQTCTVANGSGTVTAAGIPAIVVSCS
jgi:hypothetical protein